MVLLEYLHLFFCTVNGNFLCNVTEIAIVIPIDNLFCFKASDIPSREWLGFSAVREDPQGLNVGFWLHSRND